MPKRTYPSSDDEEETQVVSTKTNNKVVADPKKGQKKEKVEERKAKKRKVESSSESSSSSSDSSSESEQESKKKSKKPVKETTTSTSTSAPSPAASKSKATSSDKKSKSEVEAKPDSVVAKKADSKGKGKSKVTEEEEETNEHMTEDEVKKWRELHNLTILGDNCPPPFAEFAAAPFPDYIRTALKEFKFEKPTPIQAQGWPLGLKGRDIIGVAETGSGKTLAFGIPAIIHIMNKSPAERKTPSVVVLAPTRELAQQIEEVMQKACAPCGIKCVCIFGGLPKPPQAAALKAGAEIIIATPGRLIDFLQDGVAKLQNVSYLVLDEADRMLDMGFQPQIRSVIQEIKGKRQTLMYSATWPTDVQVLASTYFNDPIRITIGSENLSGAKKVTQIVEVCEDWDKRNKVKALLKKLFVKNCKILIFMLYKKSCEAITRELQRDFPCDSLHGDKSQVARDQVIAKFRKGEVPILIATDVAARGLDIKDIKYVINVEMPLVMEDYVHRIGRTGRAGEVGHAHTFFSVNDKQHARQLVRILEESGQKVDAALAKIAETAPQTMPKKNAMQQMYGDYAKNFDPNAVNNKPARIVFDD